MYRLAIVFLILTPIASIQFELGGPKVAWAVLASVAIAVAGTFQFVSGNWAFPSKPAIWLSPFIMFLAVGLFSLLTGPYRGPALSKGIVQVCGVGAMLLTILAMTALARERRQFMVEMLRWTSMVLGVIGLIALFQFAVNNLFQMELVRFDVLDLMGGRTAWYSPGQIAGLFRANSIEPEPAHMTTYLSLGAGLAVARLGGLGPAVRQLSLVRSTMPLWAATGILAGFAVSVSLMGYIGIIAAWLATGLIWLTLRPRLDKVSISPRPRWRFYAIGLLAVALCASVPFTIGDTLFEKLSTISLIYDNPGAQTGNEGGSDVDVLSSGAELAQGVTTNLSALALAVNANVMVTNLRRRPGLGVGIGAHPDSYDDNLPDYAKMVPSLVGMNRDEAGALIFRLLSETGLIGTALFLWGCGWSLLAGIRAIKICRCLPGGAEVAPIAAATAGSWITILALYLTRFGGYFSPVFWTSLAFLIIIADWLLQERHAPRKVLPVSRDVQLGAGLSLTGKQHV